MRGGLHLKRVSRLTFILGNIRLKHTENKSYMKKWIKEPDYSHFWWPNFYKTVHKGTILIISFMKLMPEFRGGWCEGEIKWSLYIRTNSRNYKMKGNSSTNDNQSPMTYFTRLLCYWVQIMKMYLSNIKDLFPKNEDGLPKH